MKRNILRGEKCVIYFEARLWKRKVVYILGIKRSTVYRCVRSSGGDGALTRCGEFCKDADEGCVRGRNLYNRF